MAWSSKNVVVTKKARGLKQTYESLMFTPIKLATIYFEDLGIQLGADLDADLVDVLINGEQGDGSEAATVMGVETPNTLTYADIVRVWVRMNRLNRPSRAIVTNEEDAVHLLNMSAFQLPVMALGSPLTKLNLRSPLPSEQSMYVHSGVPSKQILLIDPTKCIVQLTAMPLLIESERIIERQLTGEYASIITGFAIVFGDARVLLDYSANITGFPGPVVPTG